MQGARERIRRWRRRAQSREMGVEAYRQRLREEAAVRGGLLSGTIEREEFEGPPATKPGQRAVFVLHSAESGRALRDLAGRARVVEAREGSEERFYRKAGVEGSWLLLEEE